jgi:hypothetical protein
MPKIVLIIDNKERIPVEQLVPHTLPELGFNIMHGRIVKLLPAEHAVECGDCPEPAKFRVQELTDSVISSWYWCGRCDIGG